MLLIFLLACSTVFAQTEMPLWPDQLPPYSKNVKNTEYVDDCWGGVRCARNVTLPTLTMYPASQPSQVWILVVPGGGYDAVAIFHEGSEIAQAFVDRGISAAVLKYRVPDEQTATKPEQVPFADFRRGMELLRAEQVEAGVSDGKIGVVGFSASGHLALYSMVHPDPEPALNVDFAILAYGTSKLNPTNRDWLEKNLYYRSLDEEEERHEALLDWVTEVTPPAFLVHAVDDNISHYTETTNLADALRAKGVAAEVHLFAKGGHGFGPGRDSDGTNQWLDLAANWVKRLY
ncbi:MAG: alpha/beta hydrolase [Woeseiaceae bacterium]